MARLLCSHHGPSSVYMVSPDFRLETAAVFDKQKIKVQIMIDDEIDFVALVSPDFAAENAITEGRVALVDDITPPWIHKLAMECIRCYHCAADGKK